MTAILGGLGQPACRFCGEHEGQVAGSDGVIVHAATKPLDQGNLLDLDAAKTYTVKAVITC
ncbi:MULTISPECIES: hypothetical protein [unclassified Chelatococcus]|uniref:hypothetical protein n=1 Tax=unclassified Chelatococcus TaxID=2638111 RepID=UPI001BD0826F|nr:MULTISPECIES: hypothetical protein [unclassified Chelatococcus]CAH1673131.1 hypothetical protein CHELA20_51020 [Hyphomicrobiales bacterium]MBS7738862.1 hypothetical protein [Chelatococcus sp. HY11]MBX3547118.1 hypothetical protein [Chelatococcus sp.]MCO5076610.1 hypothetical protein [Chelatococcus sp.]CAH1674631.1 hypothetical protein CHELA41_23992 [Hyphomicrobiales bacterium]